MQQIVSSPFCFAYFAIYLLLTTVRLLDLIAREIYPGFLCGTSLLTLPLGGEFQAAYCTLL